MTEMEKYDSMIKGSGDIEEIIAERTADLIIRNKELQQEVCELKKAEDDLKKCEKRFRLLMEHTPDLLFINDADGKIIDANQTACQALGYTHKELLNLSIADIEEQISVHHEKLKKSMRGIPVTFEGTHKRKDGTRFPVEVRLWTFESGQQELMLALVRDISERQREEEERKKLESQLIFSQKMQSIGTLASGIAHNFNNILMGIQGNVSLMMFDKKPEDPEYIKLSNIEELIDNGAKLTNQLSGFARDSTYRIKDGDLNKLVINTLDIYFKGREDITIDLDLSRDPDGTQIDEFHIKQVLIDLFSNASDAMADGGTLYVKTRKVTHNDIRGTNYKPVSGWYTMLSVGDTGTGMRPEVMSRIYEPFFTTKGPAKRAGLGMASVYGIIKGHKGYIEVESEIGRGTTFSIYLPIIADSSMEKEKISKDYLRGKETILLADDDKMVLETGEEILSRLGYSVISAAGGRDAINLYKDYNDRINLVLLDMVMPEIDGREVFNRIKEINPDIKVLLLSGQSLDEEADDILKRGCDGFIQKPFRTMELSKRLREILDK